MTKYKETVLTEFFFFFHLKLTLKKVSVCDAVLCIAGLSLKDPDRIIWQGGDTLTQCAVELIGASLMQCDRQQS